VAILGDGEDEAGPIAKRRAVAGAPVALPDPPAVVAAEGDDVDLLDRVLADIGGIEVPGAAVEGKPPRVAETVGIDLVSGLPDCLRFTDLADIIIADSRRVLSHSVSLSDFAVQSHWISRPPSHD